MSTNSDDAGDVIRSCVIYSKNSNDFKCTLEQSSSYGVVLIFPKIVRQRLCVGSCVIDFATYGAICALVAERGASLRSAEQDQKWSLFESEQAAVRMRSSNIGLYMSFFSLGAYGGLQHQFSALFLWSELEPLLGLQAKAEAISGYDLPVFGL